MTIRSRILLALLAVSGLGLAVLVRGITSELKPQLRQSTEEPLIETARVLAALVGAAPPSPAVPPWLEPGIRSALDQRFEARIYDFAKRRVELRVYVTDVSGRVLYDSQGRAVGQDYADKNDVFRTLRGKYGARTAHENAADSTESVMYVAAPIFRNGTLAGVLSVGKPTLNVNQFASDAQSKLLWGASWILVMILVVAWLVAARINRPIAALIGYARDVRDGRRVRLPRIADTEMARLGAAFEEMRETLEGRRYVESYVETLTHEIKSPVAAIRGAAELLQEEMPADRRVRFLANISGEIERIESIVEKMLLLTRIEKLNHLQDVQAVEIAELVDTVTRRMQPILEGRRLVTSLDVEAGLIVNGDAFLLEQMLRNVLHNAAEFSPPESRIVISARAAGTGLVLAVEDEGSGIPAWAIEKVCERFFSLARPETGKKGSGLGLALVKEVMAIHGGRFEIVNRTPRGVRVAMELPRAGARAGS